MTTLVTGGAGFVGLNVVETLLAGGEEVVLFDRRRPPAAAVEAFGRLPGTLRVVEGDVLDGAAVGGALARHRVGRLLHAAAVTAGPARERSDPQGVVRVNVLGTVEVLEAARRQGVARILHVSTAAVYGTNGFGPAALDEEATVPLPDTLYGITKYTGERLALRARALHGLDLVVARLGTVFGRWEHETGVRDTPSALLAVTRRAEAGDEAVLPRAGRRDWIYAPDVARALVALLASGIPPGRVYHVGSGVTWSVEAWCARLQGRFPRFRYRVAREPAEATVDFHGERDRAPLAVVRLRADTGFVARYGLEEAFADYLDWRAAHRV